MLRSFTKGLALQRDPLSYVLRPDLVVYRPNGVTRAYIFNPVNIRGVYLHSRSKPTLASFFFATVKKPSRYGAIDPTDQNGGQRLIHAV